MKTADIINTAGVSFILLAFVLLQLKKLDAENRFYLLLNLAGAGLACAGSWMIQAWPFVVLEAVWAVVAVAGLLRAKKISG